MDLPYLYPDDAVIRRLAARFQQYGFPYVNVMSTKILEGEDQGFFLRTLTANTESQDVRVQVKEVREDGSDLLFVAVAVYPSDTGVFLEMILPRSEARYIWSGTNAFIVKALQEARGEPSRTERKSARRRKERGRK